MASTPAAIGTSVAAEYPLAGVQPQVHAPQLHIRSRVLVLHQPLGYHLCIGRALGEDAQDVAVG